MKATNVVLFVLLLTLAACSAPQQPAPAAPTAGVPTVAAPQQASAPLLTSTPAPARLPLSSAEERGSGGEISIGVPAGDAYAPYSMAIDPAKNIAYVYHADSAEKRPVISVVDLASGQVTRLIRLHRTTPGGPGRLFLTPDGKRLYLQESQDLTVLAIDTGTGSLRKVLDGARDAAFSDDGRVIYALRADSVAAYTPAELLLGRTEPIWQTAGQYARMALNGQRLLMAAYGRVDALTVLDAATGEQVGESDAPETQDAVAAGPEGGWAIVVSGENPRLIRYDAGLEVRGETPIPYASSLTYDAARSRYLVGGSRYDDAGSVWREVILSVAATDGALLDEEPWFGLGPPNLFAPWRSDALVAFAAGGAAQLAALDARSLEPTAQIPTGRRAMAVALDEQAQRLYVADDIGQVHVVKLPTGEVVDVWEGRAPLALDAANDRLYVNRGSGVVALDAATGEVVASFPQAGWPAPDPQADLVYIANSGVTIYDRSGKQLGDLPSTSPVERGFSPNPSAYAAQVNPVTGHVAVIMNNGIPGSNAGSFLRIYPRQSDQAVTPDAPHSFVLDLTADRAGNWYVAYSTARNQEAVHVLSPDGKPLRKLDHRTGYLVLDEAADSLYLFTDGRVTRLEASTLTATDVREGPPVTGGVAHSPATGVVYTVDGNGPRVSVVPLDLDKLAPLDLSPAPGRPASDAYHEGMAAMTDGRQRLVLARFGNLYRTTDGASWERLLPGLELLYGYVTAANPRTIFVTGMGPVGGEAVWRSTDGGDTWEWLAAGLTDLSPASPVLANSADEAYFVNRGQGLLRWEPAVRKWQLVAAQPAEASWESLSLAPDGTLFRSSGGYLERSANRGASWERLGETAQTGDVIGYSTLYTVTHTLFSAVKRDFRFAGLNRSTDGGKTWQPSLIGPLADFDGYSPRMTTGFGRTYLLLRSYAGARTLLRTADDGATWQSAPSDAVAGVDDLAVDPVDGRLWLGLKGEVRTLDPEKLAWTPVQAAPASAPGPTPAPRSASAATPTVGPCTLPLTGPAAALNARNLGIGCPKGSAATVQMARQSFQNGQMIWRADSAQIYVLYNDGNWEGYKDKWLETDPASDPTIVAPGGLQQPVRGFGKVWREELGGRQAAIGWALSKEVGVQGLVEDWDHGVVLRFGGEEFVLLARGEWK